MSAPTAIARTCRCGLAESVEPNVSPTICPRCGARWCPYCWERPATVRWVPLGCQGTRYHVTVCTVCLPRCQESDRPTPRERT